VFLCSPDLEFGLAPRYWKSAFSGSGSSRDEKQRAWSAMLSSLCSMRKLLKPTCRSLSLDRAERIARLLDSFVTMAINGGGKQ
jgi:hypothetical protein